MRNKDQNLLRTGDACVARATGGRRSNRYGRDSAGAEQRQSVGAIIGSYKSAVSTRIHEVGGALGPAIWQRNYYEHIIRNDMSLNRIRQYVLDNPVRWVYDRYNPQVIRPEADDPW